jgi:O-antigen ligase
VGVDLVGLVFWDVDFTICPTEHRFLFGHLVDGTGPVAMAIGLLVLILVQHIATKLWLSAKNIMLGIVVALCIAALVMLGSRGTFLGLALATVFFFFTIRGFWNKFGIVLLIGGMSWFIFYIDQSSIGNKVLSTRVEQATEEDTREGRRFINSAVLLAFPESPIIGKGTGSWRHYNNKYIAAVFDKRYPKDLVMADAHSTPLHLLFEHGLVGAGLFLTAVFFLFKRSYKLSTHTGIFVFPLIVFSFTIGLSTMHKQAPMFLPFFLAVAALYRKASIK